MSSDSARPFDGTRPADVLEKDFYDTIEETVQQSGTTFPTWDRADPKRIGLTTCAVGAKNGNKLSITLDGGAIQDPRGAVKNFKAYWESKGWKIGNIFDNTNAPNPGMEIGGTSPTGIFVVFSPIKNATGPADQTDWSMIQVESDCSLDPSLERTPSTPGSSS